MDPVQSTYEKTKTKTKTKTKNKNKKTKTKNKKQKKTLQGLRSPPLLVPILCTIKVIAHLFTMRKNVLELLTYTL